MSFTVDGNEPLEALLEDLKGLGTVGVARDRTIVAIVGERLKFTPGVTGRCFGALREINVEMISMGANEMNLSFVVKQEDAKPLNGFWVISLNWEFHGVPSAPASDPSRRLLGAVVRRPPLCRQPLREDLVPQLSPLGTGGFAVTKPTWEVSEHDWDALIDTGFKGVFFCCQAIGSIMRQHGYGKIINNRLTKDGTLDALPEPRRSSWQ